MKPEGARAEVPLALVDTTNESNLASSDRRVRHSNPTSENIISSIRMYDNESIIAHYAVQYVNYLRGGRMNGYLYLTAYRLGFVSSNPSSMYDVDIDFCVVTMASIERVKKLGKKSFKRDSMYGIDVTCKDFRSLRFLFPRESSSRSEACANIKRLAFPGQASYPVLLNLIQFEEARSFNGWELGDIRTEYTRFGLPSLNTWRISYANAEYKLCSSYPAYLIVPASVDDSILESVARFRSRGRIPVLCWKHSGHHAAIIRCSQPRVGLAGNRSLSDELLIREILLANPSSKFIHVYDCRPHLNALGNQVKGDGTESTSNYSNLLIEYMNIENIHAIRTSYQKLKKICLRYGQSMNDPNTFHDQPPRLGKCEHWYSSVHDTKWLLHIRIILTSVTKMIKLVDGGNTAIVHCSDGWDRTPQLTSLAMLCLDPYYRTTVGFMSLIEKEWGMFGHKFYQRVGHGNRNRKDEQRSPIFIQFMDCVWQISVQYPHAFEFNELLMAHILDHVHSCRFGTFLYNNEKERNKADLKTKTDSLWTFLYQNKETLYKNTKYVPHQPSVARDMPLPPLIPNPHSISITLWVNYYLRWTPHAPFLRTPCPSEFFDYQPVNHGWVSDTGTPKTNDEDVGAGVGLVSATSVHVEEVERRKSGMSESMRSSGGFTSERTYTMDPMVMVSRLKKKLWAIDNYLSEIGVALPSDLTPYIPPDTRLSDSSEDSSDEMESDYEDNGKEEEGDYLQEPERESAEEYGQEDIQKSALMKQSHGLAMYAAVQPIPHGPSTQLFGLNHHQQQQRQQQRRQYQQQHQQIPHE